MSERPAGRSAAATLPITLAELCRIDPLSSAQRHIADGTRGVEQVVLAETVDRVRRCLPHSLIVLHADAATGGWSLAAALHLAWERNAAGVVVASSVSGASSAALAERLHMSLFVLDADPVDAALHLAGQVSAPDAARALRLARCAERLAEQTGIRGILGVLNAELDPVPVALVAGGAPIAGRSAATTSRPDVVQVAVDVDGPGEPHAGRLVAAVPAHTPAAVPHVEALLRLARTSLVAARAQSRLTESMQAAHEQAAFALLRRHAEEQAGPARPSEPDGQPEPVAPTWSSELGWRVTDVNRAVWIAALRPHTEPPAELTPLVRAVWQRGRPTWPLIVEGDGWLSWFSTTDPDALAPLRRALTAFRDTAGAHQLVLGVGRAHRGIPGLLRSLAEARLAAHVAREHGPATVRWFDQVGPEAALAWLPTGEIAQVADLCLSELMSARDRGPLVDTVLAVLDCGGSLSQAARRLGVHRNTVLARVARARQLGLAFEDPDQRLALHLLCYALGSGSAVPPGSTP